MSNVIKPPASQGKPKVATECRDATPEETRALLGRGWVIPVPRPQKPSSGPPPPTVEGPTPKIGHDAKPKAQGTEKR